MRAHAISHLKEKEEERRNLLMPPEVFRKFSLSLSIQKMMVYNVESTFVMVSKNKLSLFILNEIEKVVCQSPHIAFNYDIYSDLVKRKICSFLPQWSGLWINSYYLLVLFFPSLHLRLLPSTLHQFLCILVIQFQRLLLSSPFINVLRYCLYTVCSINLVMRCISSFEFIQFDVWYTFPDFFLTFNNRSFLVIMTA